MPDDVCINLARYRLEKARRAFKSATENIGAGDFETANNRAYYSVFNSIRAVLALDSVDFKTHSHTIGYFNQHYIKEGIFDSVFSRMIQRISQSRNKSDYEDFYVATRQEAETNIEGSRNFLEAVDQYVSQRIESEQKHGDYDKLAGINETDDEEDLEY